MGANNSELTLKTIYDLLGEQFYIPSYQRGYRWTERQVEELLNDIWEFSQKKKNDEEFYCLQPIVLSRTKGKWEVVDGQQRLTTIRIILYYLVREHLKRPLEEAFKKPLYEIDYQTREEEFKEFLDNISETDDNIDFSHIWKAFEKTTEWFSEKDYNECNKFIATLLAKEDDENPVKVIWYDISDVNKQKDYAIDVFTRINIGKIPLTNAELIKALFLGKIKSKEGDDDRVFLKRLQIATEWDDIEYTLQREKFWHFIYEGSKNYDTRIEYIFDLMKEKPKDAEPYYTFHAFNKDFDSKEIDEIWLMIKKYFQIFQNWYNNRMFYHYVGYLVAIGTPISDLIKHSRNMSKTEFKQFLINKISDSVNYDIEDLEYGNTNMKHIRPALLLFNIQTLVNNPTSNSYFPFDLYKIENWDIEHIRSVQSEKPVGSKQRSWLEVVLKYFTGVNDVTDLNKISSIIDNLESKQKKIAEPLFELLQNKKITEESFTSIYNQILKHFKEDSVPETINSISNLTLLDAQTNRSYKNAPFPVKRKIILGKDSESTFIPIGTRNVFLKAYSYKFSNVMYWQDDDEESYLNNLKETLKAFDKNIIES